MIKLLWLHKAFIKLYFILGVLYEEEVLKRVDEVKICIGMARDNVKERCKSRKQIDWMNEQKLFFASEKWKENEGPGTNKLKEILSKVNAIDLHVKYYKEFHYEIEKEKRNYAEEDFNDRRKNSFQKNNYAQKRKRNDDWQNNSCAQTLSKRKKNATGTGYYHSFSENESNNFNIRKRFNQDTSATSRNKRVKLGNINHSTYGEERREKPLPTPSKNYQHLKPKVQHKLNSERHTQIARKRRTSESTSFDNSERKRKHLLPTPSEVDQQLELKSSNYKNSEKRSLRNKKHGRREI